MIEWQWRRLEDLTTAQIYSLFAARCAVFIVEQNCVYQDLDGLDLYATHLIGWRDDEVAACLRLLAPGIRYAEASIGRVLTSGTSRGTGAGRQMLSHAVAHIDQQYPSTGTRISAQAHLQSFYAEWDFSTVSAVYLEDGIPHVEMLRAPAQVQS